MGRLLPEIEIDTRALRPVETPNDTVPPASDPGTVGPPDYRPGDPDGVMVLASDDPPPNPPSIIRPSPWSGWPDEWNTPNWYGRAELLTDTAWMCIDLNSSIMASMPPYLVGASATLPDDWLTNPDPNIYSSWVEFFKQLVWDFHLGEAFVLSTARYSNGWPARFHVVSPWLINAEMVGGLRRYSIGNIDVTNDILHIRYQSRTDDAHGHGPLEAGRSRVIAAMTLLRYATNMVAAGGTPNAVLKHPDELTGKQAGDLQSQWVAARMSGMGLPAVLSGGVEFEMLAFSPADMALLDLSKHNESRIAVLLGVPPFLAGLPSGGDSMTYANTTSLFDYHWRAGLRPKAQALMTALSEWLLPRGTTIELNRDAYVQPGPLERAQTWQILIGLGVVTVEQVQAIERYDVTGFVPTGVL
jgi:HK97 family phage portal protein